jgi:hypothetical protein
MEYHKPKVLSSRKIDMKTFFQISNTLAYMYKIGVHRSYEESFRAYGKLMYGDM